MDKNEKIREAQEKLDWVITHLNETIKCKVIDYKYENYRVQFFTKEGKLIMPTQIPEEWVKGTNPKENSVYDKLEALCRNLEKI